MVLLAPVEVEPLDATPPDRARASVVIGIDFCMVDPPGARVRVWTNGVPLTRFVTLTDAGSDARDRTLALALAEATRDYAFPALAGANHTFLRRHPSGTKLLVGIQQQDPVLGHNANDHDQAHER